MTTLPRRRRPVSRVGLPSLLPFLLAALPVLGAGCESNGGGWVDKPDPQEHAPLNRAMVQMLNNSAIDNAILTQRTLYPYHFVTHAAELNDLGRRDLAVLGNHLRRHPGALNVRRADVGEALYEARLDAVRRQLVEFGVAMDEIEIADRLPDGDGVNADRAILIRNRLESSPGIRSSSGDGA